MAMFAKADSIISSNLIAGAVVGAAIVEAVPEVGSSAAAVTKCSISFVDHRRIEVEEDRVADNSEEAGLG